MMHYANLLVQAWEYSWTLELMSKLTRPARESLLEQPCNMLLENHEGEQTCTWCFSSQSIQIEPAILKRTKEESWKGKEHTANVTYWLMYLPSWRELWKKAGYHYIPRHFRWKSCRFSCLCFILHTHKRSHAIDPIHILASCCSLTTNSFFSRDEMRSNYLAKWPVTCCFTQVLFISVEKAANRALDLLGWSVVLISHTTQNHVSVNFRNISAM